MSADAVIAFEAELARRWCRLFRKSVDEFIARYAASFRRRRYPKLLGALQQTAQGVAR